MALVTVHSIRLVRQFQSTWFSRAAVFVLFCSVLCLIVPLLVAYSSQGFWVKHDVIRERPTVRFKYQALLLARSASVSDDSYVTWSTYGRYNDLNDRHLIFPTITSSEKYLNDDDQQPDGLELDMHLELSNQTAGPQFVQLLLVFSYQLKVFFLLIKLAH